ncbi:MAG: type II toxin-antitoxin system HigB family toxin [Planctomycetaceae bacterium]|nr:type II toxin-antitoxin system HigB family toxin [Planctomycetaceae bacterium]
MRVISKKPLREYWGKRPDTKSALEHWWKVTRKARWRNFADVRQSFGSADQRFGWTIFNIGGNKCRLVAKIDHLRGRVYVHRVMTHGEYDRGDWLRE